MSPAQGRPLDESDVRVRANPRGSRPRTKERPRHEAAVPAQVLAVDRGRFTLLLGSFAEPAEVGHQVTAMKARELGRAGVVVGDRVAVVGDVSGAEGSLARIVRVEERRNFLRRSADDTDPVERPIVANADQLAVVTALAQPEPRRGMIDRCLVAAFDAGVRPLLVLTKADLADPEQLRSDYARFGVPALVLGRTCERDRSLEPEHLAQVRSALSGRVSVLVGHSGVGKSTLVNELVPGADRSTGVVNDVTGRGRHTSTSARALPLAGGGWVIDTPGVRSFGLAHVDPDRIVGHFPDLAPGTEQCPRGCSHDEPECALDAFVEAGSAGPAGPARLASLRRLLRSRAGGADGEPHGHGP